MTEESRAAFVAAAFLILFGAAGLFLPPPWNPFRLKKRYEKHVRPALANAIPRVLGIGFLLLGLVAVAVGVVMMQ
jgi:Mn2+/Fe2+ NRAMP family transporter